MKRRSFARRIWRAARARYAAFEFRFLELYASFWARLVVRIRRPRIVGITGSVGKTTTQGMVAAVLTSIEARSVVGSAFEGPMNGRIGLPMSMLGYHRLPRTRREKAMLLLSMPFRSLAKAAFLQDYPAVLVLEYGMSSRGYMAQRAKLGRPEVAVVTAVGPAHLTYFNSVERVAEEKSALVRAVPRSGLVVLARDDEYVSRMARDTEAFVVQVPGRGSELSRNIARVVGGYFGLTEETIERALSGYRPPPGRLNILELGTLTVIDDSYNANPLSMKLGLDTLAGAAKAGQRKIAVLGDMAELGEDSPRYHREVGVYARERADIVIGVGSLAREYEADHWMVSTAECTRKLPELIHRNDCVFVKGSNIMHLDDVVDALKRINGEHLDAADTRAMTPVPIE